MDDFFKNLRDPEHVLNIETISNTQPPMNVEEGVLLTPPKEEEIKTIKNVDMDGIVQLDEVNEKFDELADQKTKDVQEDLKKQTKPQDTKESEVNNVVIQKTEEIKVEEVKTEEVRNPIKRIDTDGIINLEEINEKFNDLADQKKAEALNPPKPLLNKPEDVRDAIKNIDTDGMVNLDEINEKFNDLADQKKAESQMQPTPKSIEAISRVADEDVTRLIGNIETSGLANIGEYNEKINALSEQSKAAIGDIKSQSTKIIDSAKTQTTKVIESAKSNFNVLTKPSDMDPTQTASSEEHSNDEPEPEPPRSKAYYIMDFFF